MSSITFNEYSDINFDSWLFDVNIIFDIKPVILSYTSSLETHVRKFNLQIKLNW